MDISPFNFYFINNKSLVHKCTRNVSTKFLFHNFYVILNKNFKCRFFITDECPVVVPNYLLFCLDINFTYPKDSNFMLERLDLQYDVYTLGPTFTSTTLDLRQAQVLKL